MKEARVCFSAIKLTQKWRLSREHRPVLESKGVSKDKKIKIKIKQVLSGKHGGWGMGAVLRKTITLVFFLSGDQRQ